MTRINKEEMRLVKDILSNLPYEAIIFGSRATGVARPDSDLDLCLRAANGSSIPLAIIGDLREKFQNSRLPFVVDLVDYASLSQVFQNAVLSDGVKI